MKKKYIIFTVLAFILIIFSISFLRNKFFKYDIDENGNRYASMTIGKCKIHTNPDGHRKFKIDNNSYVFLEDIRIGDIITMPNTYGCAQFAIYSKGKAIIFHHASNTNPQEARDVIQKYIHRLDKNEIFVSFLFPAHFEKAQAEFENIIKEEIFKFCGKNISINKTIYEKYHNGKPVLLCYKSILTKNGFVDNIVVKDNYHILRGKKEVSKAKTKINDIIKIHDLYNEYYLIVYADKKLVMLRNGLDDNVPPDLLDIFSNNKPQIHLILPKNSKHNESIINEINNVLKKQFKQSKVNLFYYRNCKPYKDFYDGKITKKGLKGKIKKYEKNALYVPKES